MRANLRERCGEWAVVTGASSGIGQAFARRFAAERLNVALCARREERLKALAGELGSRFGVSVVVAPSDLTREEGLAEIIERTKGLEVGVLVNNAGFAVTGRFFENDADRQADTVRLNCVAPAVLARHFLPAMVKRGRGAVITISSVVAGQPTPYWATYSASKVFELYLGEALAYELRGSGVDSLVVMPGATKTEFQSVASVGEIPLSRTPEQVVETALDALGRRTWVVDGLANRIRFALVRLLPGRLVIGSAGRIMSRRLR